ncbi:helix-turn-helix transcriptional regulator [Paraburkholderia bryophila]|uniref:helix-turn-helix transcriptional regulator n=1 Tax=Burkholderiaceae TaxID=119060 RepID=UPI0009DDE909|nr:MULTISPECIES: helix-turn-helix transcriptional regulator [Burkholderiaceae]
MSTIAQHIRTLMRRHGIASVNELSKRSGITLSALQALVNGASNPRASTLRVLGNFFGVSPADLASDLAGTDTEPVLLQSTAHVLRYLMDDVCVSERELARLTGVSQKAINNILLGRTATPTDATLALVAEFFSVTTAQLRADQPLDRQRRKGETNERLLRTHRVSTRHWRNRRSTQPEWKISVRWRPLFAPMIC